MNILKASKPWDWYSRACLTLLMNPYRKDCQNVGWATLPQRDHHQVTYCVLMRRSLDVPQGHINPGVASQNEPVCPLTRIELYISDHNFSVFIGFSPSNTGARIVLVIVQTTSGAIGDCASPHPCNPGAGFNPDQHCLYFRGVQGLVTGSIVVVRLSRQ